MLCATMIQPRPLNGQRQGPVKGKGEHRGTAAGTVGGVSPDLQKNAGRAPERVPLMGAQRMARSGGRRSCMLLDDRHTCSIHAKVLNI